MSGGTAMLPKAGDIIDGKYELVSLLGQGGMGAVYKARHRTLSKECAIKVMLADAGNPEALARFEREGRAAANLHSEHIVRVVDVDQEHGYAYMVLELLEGEDLSQVLDRERCLQPHVAVGYVMQALEGVKEAHAQGIVHRDLKPSNLFLARKRDGSTIIKVLDFGISKAGNANVLSQTPGARTSTKAMLGSPLYMSPEQLRSSKSVDQRADIWAIGVILFELLTGSLPFMGENLGELFAAILETEAPDVRKTSPLVPQPLAEIVTRCLQRKVEMRYQNAADLLRDLAPFASPGVAPGMPMQLGTAMMSPGQNPAANMRHGGSGQLMQTPSGLPGGVPSMPGGPPMGPPVSPNPYAVSRQGAITGSGAHVPVVKGTAPLGAITPQPNGPHAWPNTNDGAAVSLPKSNGMPIVIGVFAVLVIVGVGLIGWTKLKGKPKDDPTTTASAAVSADPTPPPSASTATIASATPAASATTPAPASAASSAAPPTTTSQVATTTGTGPKHTGTGTHSKPAEPKPPEPPKLPVDPPKPPVDPPKTAQPNPPVKPPPKPTSNVQTER